MSDVIFVFLTIIIKDLAVIRLWFYRVDTFVDCQPKILGHTNGSKSFAAKKLLLLFSDQCPRCDFFIYLEVWALQASTEIAKDGWY